MKVFLSIVSIFYSLIGLGQHTPSPGPGQVSMAGVDYFWPILKNLEEGKEPSEKAWSNLFQTPCYHYIIQSTPKEKLKQRFRTAYLPEMDSIRQSIANKGGYDAMILDHLLKIPREELSIKKYADSLRNIPFIKQAIPLTAKYLPREFVIKNQDLYPPVAFGVFEPDGKASSKLVALDIQFTRQIDFQLFIAHEAHHFFMGRIQRKTMETDNRELQYLLMSIRQLHLEGIADLIDKKGILKKKDVTEEEDWYAYHYNNYYEQTPSTLKKINALFERAHKEGEHNGTEIWSLLHFGTHPEALYLANTIEAHFGKDYIIQILDNPFEILKSYQKIANEDPSLFAFSKSAMQYLAKIEKDYLLN